MARERDQQDRDERDDKPEKAYKDLDFIMSRAGRPIRILSEFLEPEDRFERYNISDTIVFFGSARTLSREEAYFTSTKSFSRSTLVESSLVVASNTFF